MDLTDHKTIMSMPNALFVSEIRVMPFISAAHCIGMWYMEDLIRGIGMCTPMDGMPTLSRLFLTACGGIGVTIHSVGVGAVAITVVITLGDTPAIGAVATGGIIILTIILTILTITVDGITVIPVIGQEMCTKTTVGRFTAQIE
jgi:hypothetical protein